MSFVFRDLFPDERSYRLGEVARRLGVHVDTVRRWTNQGDLACFKLGGQRRISYNAIRTWIDAKMAADHKNLTNLKPAGRK